MTVGRRQYNEAEMMQMQREAEARVREMQRRARQTLAQTSPDDLPPPPSRNWSQPTGSGQPATPEVPPPPLPEAQAVPEPHPQGEAFPPAPPAAPPPAKGGTIIGDIMTALGLDEDYLLIIGLLLILINQRADTYLILALVYLLI